MSADLSSNDIIGTFYAELEASIGKTWVDKVSFFNPNSNKDSELYNWLNAVGGMREMVGGRKAKGLSKEGQRIYNKTYENTLEIPTDWIRRDKTKLIDAKIGELADSAAAQYASLLSTLILAGQTTTCFDGKKFFAANHVTRKSGTQKNLLTKTTVPGLQVTVAAQPTAAEAATAILGVIAHMHTIKDAAGDPMNEFAREFVVMCGPKLWQYLAPAIVADYTGYGESNKMKAIADANGYKIRLELNARYTSETEFDVFRTDARVGAFIRQEEEGVTVGTLGEGSEYEFLNGNQIFGIKAIQGVGCGLWQYGAHAALST